MPFAAVLLDSHGRITETNAAWKRFCRSNGGNLAAVSPPTDYLAVCEADGEVAAGIRAVIAGRQPTYVIEYPCHSRREERWFRLVVTPMDDGAMITHVDITGEYVRISTLLGATSVAVIELDAHLGLVFANASWRAAQPDPGARWDAHIRPEDATRLRGLAATCLRSGRGATADVRVRSRWFRFAVSAHVDHFGVARRVILVGLDVTEERQMIAAAGAAGERSRLAAELHDGVMQRLYGTAIALQRGVLSGAVDHVTVEDAITRIDRSVSDLRALARQERQGAAPVRQQVLDVIDEAAVALGFRPDVQIETNRRLLDDPTTGNLLAVVNEGLSNVARHAGATTCAVSLTVDPDFVTLTITDDGVGMPDAPTRMSGTGNIRRRAEALDGHARWDARSGGGTVLVWRVPAPSSEQARFGRTAAAH